MSTESVRSTMTIAIIASDPFSMDSDRLAEVRDEVMERLSLAQQSDLEVYMVFERDRTSLTDRLREIRPTLVEFTAYGSLSKRILLDGPRGVTNITGKTFRQIIAPDGYLPSIVVLNGCSVSRSEPAIAEAAGQVFKIPPRESDIALIRFSQRYYPFLIQGLAPEQAFKAASKGIAGAVEVRRPQKESLSHRFPDLMTPSPLSTIRLRLIDRTPDILPGRDGFVVPVWFGTNRAPKDLSDLTKGFEGRASLGDSRVYHGRCYVTIPHNHRTGSIGSPRWQFWKRDHLRLRQLEVIPEEQFWCSLSEELNQSNKERSVLCFIHGYNMQFKDAAFRTAQLCFDLNFQGEAAFFSWPSAGRLKEYPADEAAVEACEEVLKDFLLGLAQHTEAEAIHIIAHSMGNRVLLRAMNTIFQDASSDSSIPFSQVFLAAPDVDVELFERLASIFPKVVRRTTLYACPRDRALRVSGHFRNYPRAGFSPPTTIVNEIDTVEVHVRPDDLLGHSYYGESWPIIGDIQQLISQDAPPKRRTGIRSAEDPLTGRPYWIMK